jgi:hypothetical protein
MTWIAGHRKLLAACAGAAVTIAVSVWGTSNHWVELAVLVATAAGVYGVPNTVRKAAK